MYLFVVAVRNAQQQGNGPKLQHRVLCVQDYLLFEGFTGNLGSVVKEKLMQPFATDQVRIKYFGQTRRKKKLIRVRLKRTYHSESTKQLSLFQQIYISAF